MYGYQFGNGDGDIKQNINENESKNSESTNNESTNNNSTENNKKNIYSDNFKFSSDLNNDENKSNIKSISDIKAESSDKNDIDYELEMDKRMLFTKIEEIPEFLEIVKERYKNLKLNLDRHEISILLTKTLNVALLGEITTEEQIFNKFMDEYDIVKGKVNIIIEKIREFNNKNAYEYFVDLEKIVFILWFKEIKFVKNLIIDISNNLENQLNIVHINSYLIDNLYNDPRYTKYYIKILLMIIENEKYKEIFLKSDKLRNFFSIDKINKIYDMIRLILSCDNVFIDFIQKYKEEKLIKEKENNTTDKNLKEFKGFNNIEELEIQFHRNKKMLLVDANKKKRDLNVNDFLSKDKKDDNFFNKYISSFFKKNHKHSNEEHIKNVDDIIYSLTGENDDDIWSGFIFFIYKKFNITKDNFVEEINKKLMNNNKLSLLEKDFFDDLNINFSIRLNPDPDGDRGIILKGGNYIFYKKYLKYKEKYLNLKKMNT